jgi:hypothetical protein
MNAKPRINEVSVIEHSPSALAVATPMTMLAQAVERGMAVETIDRLTALAERWDATQARKAFFEAFAAFKSEAITIARNKNITDGPLKGKRYAELFSFVVAVTPALSRNGLSASWEITKDEKDWIEVTCIVEHVNGHSKRVAMGGPPDNGGAKNAIQARVSTVTYLERQTLKAACGVAEQGDDIDGRSTAPVDFITDEQADELMALLKETKSNVVAFLKTVKLESLTEIRTDKFEAAKKFIRDTAAKRAAREVVQS